MMGDYHVRFCEGLGGQFPWSTRHPSLLRKRILGRSSIFSM